MVLLGLAYAKETGINDMTSLNQEENEEMRVIYSPSKDIFVNDTEGIQIHIINKSIYKKVFYLEVRGIENKNIQDFSYTLNDGEKQNFLDSSIYLGELGAYGTESDSYFVSLKIFSEKEKDIPMSIRIKQVDSSFT